MSIEHFRQPPSARTVGKLIQEAFRIGEGSQRN